MEDEGSFTGDVRLELVKAVMEKRKPFRFAAYGSSMHPFIRDHDVVTIVPLSSDRPFPGDVVAFELPDCGTLFIHRVVTCGDNVFQIKGDNREESDGMIPLHQIIGMVSKVERNGRNVPAGLGPERALLAFMSRFGLLWRISRVIRLPNRICTCGLQKLRGLKGDSRGDSRSRSGNLLFHEDDLPE